MTAIEVLTTQPAAQAIGWALLQFVWQGALIGALTTAALAALRRSASDVRYVVGTIGLTLMLTMPVVTAVQTWRGLAILDARSESLSASRSVPAGPPVREVPVAAAGETAAPIRIGENDSGRFPQWMAIAFLVWISGVGILTLRLVSGWLWVRRMKSCGVTAAASAVQTLAGRLVRRLHVRRTVRLLESTVVEVPTVIGWLRPVVLIPASVLAGLSPHQLEAILAHELAHIRRHDYLVNLLQTLVETLLFYHPAVWWLSRRIRIEREHCCDDLAVSLCGDPVAYARALADLEELRGGRGQLVVAATGGSLLDRVRRLLGAPSHAGRGPGWLAGAASVLVISVIAGSALGREAWGLEQSQAAAAAETPAKKKAEADSRPALAASQGEAALRSQSLALEMATRAEEIRGALSRDAAAMQAQLAESAATMEVQQSALAAEASLREHEMARAMAELAGRTAAFSDVQQTEGPLAPLRSNGTFNWSNGREKLEVDYSGPIEFTDDDTDVKSITPGGWLRIREGGWFGKRSAEFRADASGQLERRFRVGAREHPYEPEGRAWVAQVLPRFIRQSGIGAAARVERILRQKGPEGVLAEISAIEGSWARRSYYTELLNSGKLEPRQVEQVLARAARDIESDFELASLLIASADRLLVTDAARRAYFDASRSIASDFEMRRVFSHALERSGLGPDALAGLLDAATSIESDFEAASLLMEVAKLHALDDRTRPPFLKVLATIDSDFEHRRVLNALVARGDAAPETRRAVLDAALRIGSDFEKSQLLLAYAKAGIQDPEHFFRAVETLQSAFERGRVLRAVINGQLTDDLVLRVLRATEAMGSSFETSQVLLALTAKHQLTGQARERYVSIAERLGEFEQGRVLAALVRSEKRK